MCQRAKLDAVDNGSDGMETDVAMPDADGGAADANEELKLEDDGWGGPDFLASEDENDNIFSYFTFVLDVDSVHTI